MALSKLGLPGSVDVEILWLRGDATGDVTGTNTGGGGGGSLLGIGGAGSTLAGGDLDGNIF